MYVCSYDDAVKLVKTESWKEKVKHDPVLVIKHAEKRLNALLDHEINNKRILPLGSSVKDFLIRWEF